ncbi:MAG: hypothetical protein WCI06_05325 [Methylococcaceae bacterium]
MSEKDPFVYINKENQSFAIQISYIPSILKSDLYKEDCFKELGIGEDYNPFSRYVPYPEKFKNDDSFFWHRIKITTIENIYSDERETHGVTSHKRELSNGKIVMVSSHKRRNPKIIKNRTINTDDVDYVIYRVDYQGAICYYGEGKESRPKHVNSGISHNFKINEHFFLNGAMKVEIIRMGLSKQESLAIEKFLIQSHKSKAPRFLTLGLFLEQNFRLLK